MESAGRYLYDPWCKRLLSNLADMLVDEPILRTDAPAGVEILLRRSSKGYLLHLFNKYAALPAVADPSRNPRIADTTVWLNPSRIGDVQTAEGIAGEGNVELSLKDTWPMIRVPKIDLHSCVSLQ
jgi:hypothetical protein